MNHSPSRLGRRRRAADLQRLIAVVDEAAIGRANARSTFDAVASAADAALPDGFGTVEDGAFHADETGAVDGWWLTFQTPDGKQWRADRSPDEGPAIYGAPGVPSLPRCRSFRRGVKNAPRGGLVLRTSSRVMRRAGRPRERRPRHRSRQRRTATRAGPDGEPGEPDPATHASRAPE